MPRHSRGCRNCVQRHILCDESYPTCKNCQARELTCDGPIEGLRIIHMNGNFKTINRKKKATSRPLTRNDQGLFIAKPGTCYLPTLYGTSLNGWGLDTYFCYLLITVGNQERIWLEHCMRDPRAHPTASLAIEALSIAKFAKVQRAEPLLFTAAQKYAKAIGALQCALKNPRRYHLDSLAAIAAMNRYEILVCTANRIWIQHVGGAGSIIETMGPSVFNRQPYKAILDTNRFRIMHEAYTRRKPTFLLQEKWQIARNPTSKAEAFMHKLQDLYGALSEIAAQAGLLDSEGTGDVRQRQEALALAHKLIRDLDAWMEDWKILRGFVPKKMVNNVTDTFYSDAEGLVFPESLSYPTLEDAIGMNMCMTTKLSAIEWRTRLQQPSWRLGNAIQTMAEIPEARLIAERICQGLHLHFESNNVVSNVYFFMFTAISPHKAFHRNSREMRWLLALLTRVADLTGFELSREWIACFQNNRKF